MKKRLLSALLALAMMLTLLPMSVFAATGGTATFTFASMAPQGGWQNGDKVAITTDGTQKITLNFTYTVGADTTPVTPPAGNTGTGGTENPGGTTTTPGGQSTTAAVVSTTVEVPRFFAGGTWVLDGAAPAGYSAALSGDNTLTLVLTSTDPGAAIQNNFGTATAAATKSGETTPTKQATAKPVVTDASGNTVPDTNPPGDPPTVDGNPADYATAAITVNGTTVTRCTQSDGVRKYGHWYHAETANGKTIYTEAQNGIIVGGRWYANPASAATNGKYPSNFTIAGQGTADVSVIGMWPTSMTVEMDGGTLSMPSSIPNTTTGLTLNNNLLYSDGANGKVSGSIDRSGANKPFTLKLTNVEVSGDITLRAARNTVTVYGGKVSGSVTLDGYYTANGRDSYNGQSLSFNSENGKNSDTTTELGGTINVNRADSSTLALHNVKGTSSSNVTYFGNQGRITVSGNSVLGTLSYCTRVDGNTTNKNVAPASVDVNGGTLEGIVQTDGWATGRATVNVDNAIVHNQIKMTTGDSTVTIGAGTTGGTGTPAVITVPKGTLNISGTDYAPTKVGNIVVGSLGAKVTMKVSGTKVEGGNISSASGTNLTLDIPKTGKPGDHAYKFGTLSLGDYAGHGIKGGTFNQQITTPHDKQWMDADVTFGVKLDGTNWTYYGSRELNQVFSDLGKDAAKVNGNVYLAGQNPTHKITLKNGNKDWAVIGYGAGSSFLLPTMMFGTPVAEWTYVKTGTSVGAVIKDNRLTTPGIPADLTLTNKAGIDIATGIRAVSSEPQGVKTTLVGNVITLSGAVRDNGNGTSRIWVTLETNVKNDNDDPNTDPDYGTVVVEVAYNTKTKETYFVTAYSDQAEALGIRVEENRLTMNDGQVVYTLNGSGLSVPAANLDIYAASTEIQASVTKNGITGAAKQELIDKLTTGAFAWNNAYAVWEGVNAALKTYGSETTVTGWINTAQSTIWRSGLKNPDGTWAKLSTSGGDVVLAPHSGNFNAADGKEGTAIASAFNKAWLVPYLQVTVTDFTSDLSTMTTNLIPSYRIIVSNAAYTPGSSVEYVVSGQTGRSLGTLTGSMTGGATLTFPSLGSQFTWAHQDATYGYEVTDGTLTINHVGSKDGLGTVVFNNTASLIKLEHRANAFDSKGALNSSGEKLYYDTLQAAVNDTRPQPTEALADAITVQGAYQGSYAISVSGLARTFTVQVLGEKRLEVPSSSLIKSSVVESTSTWTVQLLEDTVKAASGNITIANVTGGTASVSSNPAAEGQTVTITLTPAAGYRSNGVTVRTAAGTSVAVRGSGNTYTFVMPATSVTVTPSFVTGSGSTTTAPSTTTVTVASNTMGSAITTAMAGTVTGGSVVGVTTYPNAGYRTMGVNVTTNNGSTTATRTGDNSFSFTVPTNATAVTVNPVYDVDNGTKFTDVWSSAYYSNAVAWAYSKGITGGQSTYLFGSNNTCSRADMVTFLYRAAGSPSVANVRNPFVDVPYGSYYYNAVLWAYSKGITGGVDPTHFGPSQTVTRAQTVTFLYRYAGEPAASSNNVYYDVPANQYYARAVTWADNQGITNGKTPTSFAPNSGCMRAEIVTFLYRDLTGTRA